MKILVSNRGSMDLSGLFGKQITNRTYNQIAEKLTPFSSGIASSTPLKIEMRENIKNLSVQKGGKLLEELSKNKDIRISVLNDLMKVHLETELVKELPGAVEFLNNLASEKIVLDQHMGEKQKFASAKGCAAHDATMTLRTLKFFYLDESDKKTIVVDCVQKIPMTAIDELAKLELSEEILFEAYKKIAGSVNVEVLRKFDDLKLKDKNMLYEIVEKSVEGFPKEGDTISSQDRGYIAFLLSEKIAPVIETVFDPVKYIEMVSKFDGAFAVNLIKKYENRLPKGIALKDIVEDIVVEYPGTLNRSNILIIVTNVVKRIPDLSDRKSIVMTLARNYGGLTSEYLPVCDIEGISLEDKIEILLAAYENDDAGTLGFLANYKIDDLRGLCPGGNDDKKQENRMNPDDIMKVVEIFGKTSRSIPPYDDILKQHKK